MHEMMYYLFVSGYLLSAQTVTVTQILDGRDHSNEAMISTYLD